MLVADTQFLRAHGKQETNGTKEIRLKKNKKINRLESIYSSEWLQGLLLQTQVLLSFGT